MKYEDQCWHGAQHDVCLLCREDPSPASPAVGVEEEAKKYAHQKCEEFLAAHGSLPYGFHGFAKAIYLAGYSRGGEVEREKGGDAHTLTAYLLAKKSLAEKDARIAELEADEKTHLENSAGKWEVITKLRTALEAVEKERDELREGLKGAMDFIGEVNASLKNCDVHGHEMAWRAVKKDAQKVFDTTRALLASRAEPPSGERGSE